MTTPSQPNDGKAQEDATGSKPLPSFATRQKTSKDTVQSNLEETPQVNTLGNDGLPDELTEEERGQAIAALAFLNEVRNESRGVNQLPKHIGRYSIVRSLGRGGFAEVFLAQDEELDRRVALKVPLIYSEADDPTRQRFQREAKLAAMLAHPQIVPVYEFGRVGSIDFIAYGWVDGETVGDWLASTTNCVQPNLAAKIVAELARAMHFAHERGVVHRDLKPSNVLIDQSDSNREQPIESRTRITDLGLSRHLSDDHQRLTQTGQAIGTPAYMAPEQAAGSTDINAGSDIYSLGVILFEMLTGELPFQRATAIETIRAIHDEPAPTVRKIRPELSPELSAIVDKCLQKKLNQRYLSAFDLAEDLDAFVQGRSVSAKSSGWITRTVRWVARNRVVSVAAALVLLSLSIGLGAAVWQWNNAVKEKVRAEQHLSNMTAAVDLLLAEINLGDSPTMITDPHRELLEKVLRLQESLQEDASYDHESKSHFLALHRSARIHKVLGRMDEMAVLFEEQRNIDVLEAEGVDKEFIAIVFISYGNGIGALDELDKGAEAVAAAEELEQIHTKVEHWFSEEENQAKKLTLANLQGVALLAAQQRPESLLAHQRGHELGKSLIKAGKEVAYRDEIAGNLINLANAQQYAGDLKSALQSSEAAAELVNAGLEEKPNWNKLKQMQGVVYLMQSSLFLALKDKAKGQVAAQRSVEIHETLLEETPGNFDFVFLLANAYEKLAACTADVSANSKQDAIEALDDLTGLQAIGLAKSSTGKMKISMARNSKYGFLTQLKRYEEALVVARDNHKNAQSWFSDDSRRRYIILTFNAWSNYLGSMNNTWQSSEFVDAHPKFDDWIEKVAVRLKTENSRRQHDNLRTWATRRVSLHYARVGDYKNALQAIDELIEMPVQSANPEVDWAKTTSIVIGYWQKSDTYPTPESEAALARAFSWLEKAVVEKGWSDRKFFEEKELKPIVEDERFKKLLSLMREN